MSVETWGVLSDPKGADIPKGVRLDSPLEFVFYRTFRMFQQTLGGFCLREISVESQVQFEGARVDFVISLNGKRVLIVELDGHAYHSTKEQLARDKRRDRTLLLSGLPVMRFTGSEMWADPFVAATNAMCFVVEARNTERAK